MSTSLRLNITTAPATTVLPAPLPQPVDCPVRIRYQCDGFSFSASRVFLLFIASVCCYPTVSTYKKILWQSSDIASSGTYKKSCEYNYRRGHRFISVIRCGEGTSLLLRPISCRVYVGGLDGRTCTNIALQSAMHACNDGLNLWSKVKTIVKTHSWRAKYKIY